MPDSLPLRIVRAPPIVLTGLVLGGFIGGALASIWFDSPVARGVLMAFPLAIMCGWLWAICQVARPAVTDTMRLGASGIFIAPPLIALVAGLASWSTNNSPAAFAIFGFLFVGLWLSGSALERADRAPERAPIGPMLGNALLMYFSFVGVWVLRAKILRVADRAAAAA